MSNDTDDTLTVTPEMELESLKARADAMGLKYHPSIGLEKLREKVNEAVAADGPLPPDETNSTDTNTGTDAAPTAPMTKDEDVKVPGPETPEQKRARLKKEATALIRVNITCMNPAKNEWPGEIFTVGNSAVGTIKKYVPFNTSDGYHVPKMILDQIRERQCQIFVTDKSKNGVTVRKGKMIKEFAIEVLPALTQAELDELARRQAMAGSIDQ